MSVNSPSSDGMLSVVEERQKAILERFPAFARVTFVLALVGFIGTMGLTATSTGALPHPFDQIDLHQLSLGLALALLLTVFANVIVWLFVVWSLSFVPFLAFNAHRASRSGLADPHVRTRPVRWVQLYAATFLPMAVFATAWNSLPSFGSYPVSVLRIESFWGFVTLVLSTAAVVVTLLLLNRAIPLRHATIRLSLISCLLYCTLFLAYGCGFGVASHAMVFGILAYLMFGAQQFSELARRLAIHDLSPEVANKLDQLLAREHQLSSLQEDLALKKKEQEHELTRQLAAITEKKLALAGKVNEKQLEVLGHKIDNLSQAFSIVASEYNDRIIRDLPYRLSEFRANVQKLSPEAIQKQFRSLLSEINQGIEGVPESLAEVRTQLVQATNDLEKQTRLLLSDDATGADIRGEK